MCITKYEDGITASKVRRCQEEPIKTLDAYKENRGSNRAGIWLCCKKVSKVSGNVGFYCTGEFSSGKPKGEANLVYLLLWAVSLSRVCSCVCQEDNCWQSTCWRGELTFLVSSKQRAVVQAHAKESGFHFGTGLASRPVTHLAVLQHLPSPCSHCTA